MSIIVEDGTGLANAESYVSVANADAYHASIGNSTWTGTDPVKETALRRAVRYLDGSYRLRFKGIKNKSTQALEWPRAGVIDPSGWVQSSIALPAVLISATCEAALRELVSPNSLQPDLARGGAILSTELVAGPVSTSTTYASGADPSDVITVLDDLLSGLIGGGSVARITRA